MTTALIVVDVQNDFCEGGSLAVEGGAKVAHDIADVIRSGAYSVMVATRDHHIDPGDHFSDTPDFVASWPPHCVVGTPGEEFHVPLDDSMFGEVFFKGEFSAAYSGFEGASASGVSLSTWLREAGVSSVDVCGLATDYCVKATAIDAAREGFEVRVIDALTAAVDADQVPTVHRDLETAGVSIAARSA